MAASSPTRPLLIGLAVTLAAVAIFAWYSLRQVEGLRSLQTDTVDASRKDSLQLLRIQNNLHSLALAMRDMIEGTEPYPLQAWKAQFDRIRFDLEDALRIESELTPASRSPEQQLHLEMSLSQFWNSTGRMFDHARVGREKEAREMIRHTLEPQQAALTATVARLLVLNNEAEERAVLEIQKIYDGVERNTYYFVAAMLLAILGTSLYLIQANRRIFTDLQALSDQRRVLARKLISVQEEILHSVSRELHDEFGQILTAVGAMLSRAEKQGLPPDSPFRTELAEVREVAQSTLEKMRSLSQVLRPTILDDYGLEKTLEWYVNQFEKQTGIVIRYEKQGTGRRIDDEIAIHVYRILQEALNNVARHSHSSTASVQVRFEADRLLMEVGDKGIGLPARPNGGLGLVAMRERAEILQGTLELRRKLEGGTLVKLDVPLT
ncbi:MAG: histidine kinase [Bryobacteraceae bacterium]